MHLFFHQYFNLDNSVPGLRDHHINRLEKYLLVWGGKYNSIADVPDLVR